MVTRNQAEPSQTPRRKPKPAVHQEQEHSKVPLTIRPAVLPLGLSARPASWPAGSMLALQRAAGNRATTGLLSQSPAPASQGKLRVGPVNDSYEQEADQVAGQVMRFGDSAIRPAGHHLHGQTGGGRVAASGRLAGAGLFDQAAPAPGGRGRSPAQTHPAPGGRQLRGRRRD